LRDHDFGARDQLAAPALAPPREALGKIDLRIGRLPGALPQRDGGVLVVRRVAT